MLATHLHLVPRFKNEGTSNFPPALCLQDVDRENFYSKCLLQRHGKCYSVTGVTHIASDRHVVAAEVVI